MKKKINIVLVGEQQVGKTALILSILNNEFIDDTLISTIGIEKNIMEIKSLNQKIAIFDTSGQQRYRSMVGNCIKISNIIIMVYDATNHKSFEELNEWYKLIEDSKGPNCVIGLIGNKIDLDDKIEVGNEEGIRYAQSKGIRFITTSAKTHRQSFKEFINDLIIEYNNNHLEENEKEVISLEIDDRKKRRRTRRIGCLKNEIYYPFHEVYKARVFAWYSPMFKFVEDDKKSLIK